ncbi:MAG: hypothetical protein EOP83_35395 [Verrucomicrobiaceae bacterium]|nr:MAG: hypothetical protein EOP83_35395 [Verrucomicrobiaceae bacterium]
MTDTLFLLGWRPTTIADNIWHGVKRSHAAVPHPILEWLEQNIVDHSYGAYISRNRVYHLLIVHQQDQAFEFRLRWNAGSTNNSDMDDALDDYRLLRGKMMMLPEWRQ